MDQIHLGQAALLPHPLHNKSTGAGNVASAAGAVGGGGGGGGEGGMKDIALESRGLKLHLICDLNTLQQNGHLSLK